MKRRTRPYRPETLRQAAARNAYRKSPEHRERMRKIAHIGLAAIAARPKCGAKTRTTGAPCQAPAMENGRCYKHGGRVPRGDGWHVPTFPRDARRFNAKVRELQRRAEKRAARLAAMTPEELERHKRWHTVHLPGAKAGRARKREERRRAEEARALLSRPRTEPEPSADERRLMEYIDLLKAQAQRLEERERAKSGGLFD